MMRRFGSGRLRSGTRDTEGEVNPMDGVANLADVMLVFACGLMLALIINWNLDVTGADDTSSAQVGDEITDYEGVTEGEQSPLDEDAQFQEVGKVYQDPETGQFYMVITEDEEDE